MRQEEIEKLSDTLEYNRARFRLTRTTNPHTIETCTKIIKKYELKYPEEIRNKQQKEHDE